MTICLAVIFAIRVALSTKSAVPTTINGIAGWKWNNSHLGYTPNEAKIDHSNIVVVFLSLDRSTKIRRGVKGKIDFINSVTSGKAICPGSIGNVRMPNSIAQCVKYGNMPDKYITIVPNKIISTAPYKNGIYLFSNSHIFLDPLKNKSMKTGITIQIAVCFVNKDAAKIIPAAI